MDLYEALYTTRAMRRVTKEPIPKQVQAMILDAAVRAPNGGNAQGWRFLLVDDPSVRAQLQPIYRECLDVLWSTWYRERFEAARARPDDAQSKQFFRMKKSADWAADHFADYPLLLFGFVEADPTGGSIFPAVWSAMLAAHSHGVGTALTSVLTFKKAQVFDVLGVPQDEAWQMGCCVTFGYPTGRWALAQRRPVEEVSHLNRWGAPLDFEVRGPLYTPASPVRPNEPA